MILGDAINIQNFINAHSKLVGSLGAEGSRIKSMQTEYSDEHALSLFSAGRQLLLNARLLSFCSSEEALQYSRKDFMLADDLLNESMACSAPSSLIADSRRGVMSHYSRSVPYPGYIDPVPVGVTISLEDAIKNGLTLKEASQAMLAPYGGDNSNPDLVTTQAILERDSGVNNSAEESTSAAEAMLRLNQMLHTESMSKTDLLFCKIAILNDALRNGLASPSSASDISKALSDPFGPNNFETIESGFHSALNEAYALCHDVKADAPALSFSHENHFGHGR